MSDALRRLVAELDESLAARRRARLDRRPACPAGVDLTSNDTLGFAGDPELAQAAARAVEQLGVGSGGSRLLAGHRAVFDQAEAALADFSGREAALLFASGYHANVGLIPALAGRDDVVISDALNHASIIDGCRLARAERVVVPHGDLGAVGSALAAHASARRRVVLVESLYSMDGDLADLEALCDVADDHDAVVVVDEAHATGLYGHRGSGRVEALGLSERVLCTVHTGGKALGVAGAWVAGPAVLVEHLVNHARSFIYSTAPMPVLAVALMASLDHLAAHRDRVDAVHAKAARLRSALRAAGLDLGRSESPVVPIIVGSAPRALALAEGLRADGFDVRAIRPPTVPEGASRVRVTIRSPVPDAELERFAERVVARVAELPS